MIPNQAIDDTIHTLVEERLRDGDSICLTIVTTSMVPILAPGDQIIVRGISARHVRVGDMVLIKAGTNWLVHRLVEILPTQDEWKFMTKGDNRFPVDNLWTESDVRGIIIATKRNGQTTDWQSGWLYQMNRMLAWLSRHDGSANQTYPSILRGWHIALRLSAMVVGWLARSFSA